MMKSFVFAAFLSVLAVPALAVPVSPISYEMQNGQGPLIGGSFTYIDESYDRPGAPAATELAVLTGGTGDLTDGVIATQNWNVSGQTSAAPYVGWFSIDPRISFNFAEVYDFTSVTFHFDASFVGGVRPPASVEVNDTLLANVPNPGSPVPFAFTIDLTSFAAADTFVFDINSAPSSWVFLSEVTFEVAPIPLPASAVLLLGVLGGLMLARRKRA